MDSVAGVLDKKTPVCSYFVTGSCCYGNECQLLHGNPDRSTVHAHGLITPTRGMQGGNFEEGLTMESIRNSSADGSVDGLFLQFSQPNGLPQESKLATYINNRQQLNSNSVSKNLAMLSLDDGVLKKSSDFQSYPSSSSQNTSTVPTVSSSNSLPQFTSSPFGRGDSPLLGLGTASIQSSSPRLTPQPQQSPTPDRKSPAVIDKNSASMYQENVGGTTYYYTSNDRASSQPPTNLVNGFVDPFSSDPSAPRPFSQQKNNLLRQQSSKGLLQESLIWNYVIQLTSALRSVHTGRLAARTLDPTKILISNKSRLRLNCCGMFDVLSFDASASSPLSLIHHYQQEDLVALGKLVLALACNSLLAIQREHLQAAVEIVSRNYSTDLRNLILYLLSNQQQVRSVNDIMPMIGARFYNQLDAAQLRLDMQEEELSKEVENGRLLRLLAKFGTINERPQLNMDPKWSDTGDRYMLKLFRDYLFHQVTEEGQPWVDMAHVVSCLNKLDSGSPDKVCLMSEDEQNVLIASYAELKQCLEKSFNEIIQAGQKSIDS